MCLISLWGPLNVVAFNTIVFLLAMAHMKAVLSDPGTVPLPQTRLDFSDIHSVETGTSRHKSTVMKCIKIFVLFKGVNM